MEGAAQPAKRLTWAQLEAAVQCSSGAELQGSLLDLLVEKDWPLDALPLGEAVEAIRKL